MGYGDEIMASGVAQRVFDADPSMPVAICDRIGYPRWHELWYGNPVIATPQHIAQGKAYHVINNGVGCRPYIQYPFTAQRGMQFTDWQARDHVGRIYLTDDELAFGRMVRAQVGPFVMVEPDVKRESTPNKNWGREKFQSVIAAIPGLTFVRAHGREAEPLPGVHSVQTRTFRESCGILAASDGLLGTEGGMHHAAAALGKPAVVIFGGFISPRTTGYATHVNIADRGPCSPCGRWMPCDHCQKAMALITVDRVVRAVQDAFLQPLERTG